MTAQGSSLRRGCLPEVYGFTLIELLLVIAVIAILAAILLPSLSNAKAKGQRAACAMNFKQIQLAWLAYSLDHDDSLPPNGWDPARPARTDLRYWWVQGNLDYEPGNADNTNERLVTSEQYAQLGPYFQSAKILRCPSDRTLRVRSVSMNADVGGLVQCFFPPPTPVGPQRLAQIRQPSNQFVFIEEHPDGIGFVSFWVDHGAAADAKIASYPAAYHDFGANLSFADGHVEYHRWLDPDTLVPIRYTKSLAETPSANNPDVGWLQEHNRSWTP